MIEALLQRYDSVVKVNGRHWWTSCLTGWTSTWAQKRWSTSSRSSMDHSRWGAAAYSPTIPFKNYSCHHRHAKRITIVAHESRRSWCRAQILRQQFISLKWKPYNSGKYWILPSGRCQSCAACPLYGQGGEPAILGSPDIRQWVFWATADPYSTLHLIPSKGARRGWANKAKARTQDANTSLLIINSPYIPTGGNKKVITMISY